MTYWHFIIIQVNLVLFYFIYSWFSNATNHFKFNRIYLLIAPLLSVLLPFVAENSEESSLPATILPIVSTIAQPLNSISTVTFSPINLILFAGILISILIFCYHLVRISHFPKEEKLMQIGSIKIYRTAENQSFSFYKSIYINDTQCENLELVIQHELAHCKQYHSIDVLYFTVVKSLFWYNPFIYLWNKKIQENHEFLADEEVLSSNIEFEVYANTILSAHFNSRYPHLVTGFNAQSLLKKRILKMKHKNKSYMKHLILIPVLAGGLFVTTSVSNQQVEIAKTVITHSIETEATFPGGTTALQTYIATTIRYPESSIKSNEQGMVYIEFTILKSGKVTNVKVIKSTGHIALDNEAVRLVKQMPKWIPATTNGKKVNYTCQLPINFSLN